LKSRCIQDADKWGEKTGKEKKKPKSCSYMARARNQSDHWKLRRKKTYKRGGRVRKWKCCKKIGGSGAQRNFVRLFRRIPGLTTSDDGEKSERGKGFGVGKGESPNAQRGPGEIWCLFQIPRPRSFQSGRKSCTKGENNNREDGKGEEKRTKKTPKTTGSKKDA